MCWETSEYSVFDWLQKWICPHRTWLRLKQWNSLVYPTHIFKTSLKEDCRFWCSQFTGNLPHSLFHSPSLIHWFPAYSNSSLSPQHTPPSLSSSHYLPLTHQYSLEGWVASSIYFPLGCRWFCSPPAIHILDHKRRSPSLRALALPHCECHS